MYKKCALNANQLKKAVTLDKIKFKTTKDIPVLDSVIGQDRAVKAINFTLNMENHSYNLYVSGIRGTGRTTIVKDLVSRFAESRKAPQDIVYVHNFNDPDHPTALLLPNGRARILERKLTRVITNLKTSLKKTFESNEYLEKKNSLLDGAQEKKRQLFATLEEAAEKKEIRIKGTSSGFQTLPIVEGKLISEDKYQALSAAQKNSIEKNMQVIQKKLKEVLREAALIDHHTEDDIEDLNRDTARQIIESNFDPLEEEFKNCKAVIDYFKQVSNDIVRNIVSFLEPPQNENEPQPAPENKQVDKYRVNIILDNSNLKGAPVIYEMNPTYNNLFGRIEKRHYMGYLYTDYTMIRAGSLHRANGGYLILDAEQVLRQPYVYEALKRAIRSRSLVIEDFAELSGYSTAVGLRPEAVALTVKVIIIGQKRIYNYLHDADEEFRKLFKVRADFDYEVKETPTNLLKYVQFIARVVKEEKLLHFDRDAVTAIIENSYRSVDHQKRLSVRFSDVVKLIRESSYWAEQHKGKLVTARDVKKALVEDKYRKNLGESKIQGAIREKTYLFDVDEEAVGQINGLAVYSMGDYSFGKPARITVSTYIGSRGIINIERESRLSGKIHDKGILILTGYFAAKFGGFMPLSFSASVTFEQSYGMIDGDSASCAELFALLSSLSGIPIYQGIAVTGSINQKGQVQAIGGVNEKIEGFYDVCKLQKLNGKQGVIIPESNVKNLMLRSDIVEAVRNGKFNIWAIDKIEDGIRILTGKPAGNLRKDKTFTKNSVFEGVRQQIVEFSVASKKFNKETGKTPDKPEPESKPEKDPEPED